MIFLYNIGIYLYWFLAYVASPFNVKAKLFCNGRRKLLKRIQTAVGTANSDIMWFHCSSLGEFEQGRPLIEACRCRFPEYKILLTFFSPSGYEIRKNYNGVDWVFYLPMDTPRNARRFIKIIRPKKVVFIKYDFWNNILQTLKKHSIPTYVASAIFRPSQIFFKWYGIFFRKMLQTYQCLFVQNEESRLLLQSIGISNVIVTGDTRFDRVWELAQSPQRTSDIEFFVASHTVIVAGSTWSTDEEMLSVAFAAMPNNVRLIIAPHEIREERLIAIEKRFEQFGIMRYSLISKHKHAENNQGKRVFLLDTIGMLSSVYQYGAIAYIGGGFTASGIHNTLEAVVYGIPVVFGSNYQYFREACDLINIGGAKSYSTSDELTSILLQWTDNLSIVRDIGEHNKHYIASQCGATKIILDKISV